MDFGIFVPDAGQEDDTPPAEVSIEDSLSDAMSDVGDTSATDSAAPDLFIPSDATCADFCQTYLQVCSDSQATGVIPAYGSLDVCLSVCEGAAWIPGTLEDSYKNTIGCRIRSLTSDEPSIACAAGAPDGGDTCGTACQNYCDLSAQLCPLEYESVPACKGQCASMNDDGIVGVALGDTVQCRLQVLVELAITEGALPENYCPNAGIATAGPCALQPDCAGYCSEVQEACPAGGDNQQYTSVEACTAYCNQIAGLPSGTFSTDPENTVGCRMTAASMAKAAPALYCNQAGPSGDGHCGDWCTNYCELAQSTCTGDNQLFGSVEECLASCPTVGSNGNFGDLDGNSIQCRYTLLYNVAMGAIEPVSGCAHAAVTSLDTCYNPPEPPTCDEYCTNVLNACGGVGIPSSQYPNKAACMAYCENESLMDVGNGDDKEGNTRGCRNHHASLASTAEGDEANKAYLCEIAGPSGGDVCGTLKENYCDLAMTQCINANAIYSSMEHCLEISNALDVLGLAPIETEDNLKCRFKVLADGYMSEEKGQGCLEGSVYSKQCSGPINCFQYCIMVEAGCGGEDKEHPFGDGGNCEAYCQANEDKLGVPFEDNVPTFGCRYAQAKIAVKNDDGANCEAAGPSGGGLCGSACDAYCDLAPVICQNEALLYPDKITCLQQCASLPQVADENTLYGNNVQCRLNSLLSVYKGADSPLACIEASFEGFEKCLEGVEPPPKTYNNDVQPILANHCAPCHGVGSPEPGSCNGKACFVTHYSDLLEPSYYCPGKTKGECMIDRITDGSMPLIGTGPNDVEVNLLQEWVQDGMLEQQ